MSTPEKKPQPSADALASRLKESLQRRRFSRTRILLVVLALAVGFLGYATWTLFQDRGPIVPLSLIALCTVVNHDEVPEARAVLVSPEGSSARRAGLEVLFQETKPPAPPGVLREQKAATDRNGYAQVTWPLAAETRAADFRARYVDVRQRKGSEDIGRIYAWPRATAIVIVEVETALAEPPRDTGAHFAPIAPSPLPGAGEALTALREEAHFVYLLAMTDSWLSARRLRLWVEDRFAGKPGLPAGPVLGRLDSASTTPADTRRAALAELRRHFAGPLLAVVRHSEAFDTYIKGGADVLWLGPQAPPGRPQAPGWAELPDQARKILAKKS
jgi:hypothetical protein